MWVMLNTELECTDTELTGWRKSRHLLDELVHPHC